MGTHGGCCEGKRRAGGSRRQKRREEKYRPISTSVERENVGSKDGRNSLLRNEKIRMRRRATKDGKGDQERSAICGRSTPIPNKNGKKRGQKKSKRAVEKVARDQPRWWKMKTATDRLNERGKEMTTNGADR